MEETAKNAKAKALKEAQEYEAAKKRTAEAKEKVELAKKNKEKA